MRLLIRTLPCTVFFTKALETAPLGKANSVLGRFLKERVDKVEYESSFSAYQTYLERVVADNPGPSHQKLHLLDHCTRIYATYRLPSKKLNKLHNHIAEECLALCEKEGVEGVVSLLLYIHRYNPKKAAAIFKTNREGIVKAMRSFPPPVLLDLIRFLKEARIEDAVIRETCIELLYKQIDYLNELQLVAVSSYLSVSRKYVNKDFLIKFAKRVTALYKSDNLRENNLLLLLSNLSEIETNLHSRSIYVDELDELYEVAFPSLFASIHGLDDRRLNQLTSALRRSKYYDEIMLSRLVETTMRRDILEFIEEAPRDRSATLSLATFVNIVNALAVFNHSPAEFKQYALSMLKILALHKEELLTPAHFSRLVWSICILYDRSEVSQLYSLIERYLSRSQAIPLHEAMNFYYCYLYLRTSFPKINDYRDKIHESLQNFSLQTHTSAIQGEAFQTLKSLGVPCLMEYNLNNLICDIMVPEWKGLRNVIIEFHGFRHFFRNVKRLTGSNILKQKIIRSEMYSYYFVSIDEWLITDDKKQFLQNFMEHINELETKKAESKQNTGNALVPKTATRVRSRPRSFRISTS